MSFRVNPLAGGEIEKSECKKAQIFRLHFLPVGQADVSLKMTTIIKRIF